MFAFLSVGTFPTVTQVRGNFYLKMTSKQGFESSGLLSANRMLGNLCFSVEWMATRRVRFRHLSFINCPESKMWEHHISTEAPISRVTARMFPCTFWALWTDYYLILEILMRREAAGVCLIELSAILFLPSLVDISVEIILLQGVASHLLASEIPGSWPKLLLS